MKKKVILLCMFFAIKTLAQQSQVINVSSFLPEPGKYIVSGWVKEISLEQKQNYNSKINILLKDVNDQQVNAYSFMPSGNIIDGWQQVLGEIEIKNVHKYIEIQLESSALGGTCYDDIRFLPFNANMKSFVYDSETLRLMAELDENNYATFYEYDQEGGLVRVKKETEKGVFTIQESRSNTKKSN